MTHKTKILVVTDHAPSPANFAEITRLIFTGLLAAYPDDYAVHQLGLSSAKAIPSSTGPVERAFPSTAGCAQTIPPHQRHENEQKLRAALDQVKPDLVFGCGELSNVPHLFTGYAKGPEKLLLYLDCEGIPFPKPDAHALKQADLLVTLSQFSKQLIMSGFPEILSERSRSCIARAISTALPRSRRKKRLNCVKNCSRLGCPKSHCLPAASNSDGRPVICRARNASKPPVMIQIHPSIDAIAAK